MTEWRQISTFAEPDGKEVDLWLYIEGSPRSLGMSGAFRVIDAYRINGKWFHYQDGRQAEIHGGYITHWRPVPEPPEGFEK